MPHVSFIQLVEAVDGSIRIYNSNQLMQHFKYIEMLFMKESLPQFNSETLNLIFELGIWHFRVKLYFIQLSKFFILI